MMRFSLDRIASCEATWPLLYSSISYSIAHGGTSFVFFGMPRPRKTRHSIDIFSSFSIASSFNVFPGISLRIDGYVLFNTFFVLVKVTIFRVRVSIEVVDILNDATLFARLFHGYRSEW